MLAGAAQPFRSRQSPDELSRRFNSTHDPSAEELGRSRPIGPVRIFRSRICPSACFGAPAGRRDEDFRGGVAIGDQVLDLEALRALRQLSGTAGADALDACDEVDAQCISWRSGADAWSTLRRAFCQKCCAADAPHASQLRGALVPQAAAEFAVPAQDRRLHRFLRFDLPRDRGGRCSVPTTRCCPTTSGCRSAITAAPPPSAFPDRSSARPWGQIKPSGAQGPCSRRRDGSTTSWKWDVHRNGQRAGQPGAIGDAERHVFGLCLLNDWSARDVQAWEYQPLGPFLAKNFATTISPWIVTLEALRRTGPHGLGPRRIRSRCLISSRAIAAVGRIDMQLEAYLETAQMRAAAAAPQRLSHSNFRHSYWSVSQLVAHHTVNGCNLEAGDLLGSGTQSGPTRGGGGLAARVERRAASSR